MPVLLIVSEYLRIRSHRSNRHPEKIQKLPIAYLSADFLVRKLTSILLIACLCVAWVGYFLVFHVQLSTIKSEMKAFLQNGKNHSDAIQISLTKEQCSQLEWEDETEFKYKGEIYDVIEKKMIGNGVVLNCIADSKETELLQEFQRNTNRNRSNSIISQLITASFILPHDDLLKGPSRILKMNYIYVPGFLPKAPTTVVSPPPDVCCLTVLPDEDIL